jgi:hypothetical protein
MDAGITSSTARAAGRLRSFTHEEDARQPLGQLEVVAQLRRKQAVNEHSDYLRYYLVFSPTELSLPDDDFFLLLKKRLYRAEGELLETREAFQEIDAEHAAVTL